MLFFIHKRILVRPCLPARPSVFSYNSALVDGFGRNSVWPLRHRGVPKFRSFEIHIVRNTIMAERQTSEVGSILPPLKIGPKSPLVIP